MARDPSDHADLLKPIVDVFDRRLAEWGATARGVYWRSEDGQKLRFEVLSRVLEGDHAFLRSLGATST